MRRRACLVCGSPTLTRPGAGFNPNCEFRLRNEAGSFEVFARRGIAAGEEACISYGEELSNEELQERYGFSLGAANPNGDVRKAKRNPYGRW